MISVSKFAQSVVAPLAAKMDRESKVDPSIIQGLFSQGVSLPGSSFEGNLGLRMGLFVVYSEGCFCIAHGNRNSREVRRRRS